ncbi:autoinducer 2 ABC transporter substrate-binding protein [Christensenella timonensis]|uniref:autoinducer 2 ABC transporter substrate-binding protein n=1 Tax=Christensenella timonensis TaxID=1816678 RepID=UPI00082E0ACE|nr:autoinducer 2 ABC transporter substrate-binding protein [Christensenella timonensis]
MKKTVMILLAVLMVVSLAACATPAQTEAPSESQAAESSAAQSAAESPSDDTAGGAGAWKIAVVPKDSTSAWFVRMEEGVKKYAQDTGSNAYQKGPSGADASLQVQVVQDLIAQDVDAICVVPIEPDSLEPVLEEARSKGIVVITHEAPDIKACDYDIEAFNNADYGAFMMDNLAKAMGEEGVYTTSVGFVTTASHNAWADSAVARQEEAYPNMTILAEEPRIETEDDTERAYEKAKEMLKKYPDLKGFIGCCAYDPPGIARAVEELGLKGKVFICGSGMPSQCSEFMKDGTLDSVVLWDPADAGYAMCALAAKVLDGEEIKDGLDLGLAGYDNVSFAQGSDKTLVGAAMITIDASNVDQYNF